MASIVWFIFPKVLVAQEVLLAEQDLEQSLHITGDHPDGAH